MESEQIGPEKKDRKKPTHIIHEYNQEGFIFNYNRTHSILSLNKLPNSSSPSITIHNSISEIYYITIACVITN